MTDRKRDVLGRLAAATRREYGARLQGLYSFEYLNGEDDDEVSVGADVAVILADGDWTFFDEKRRLARLTFDILVETEFYIRAWPLPASAWHDPSSYSNPALVRDIKQRAASILEPAA